MMLSQIHNPRLKFLVFYPNFCFLCAQGFTDNIFEQNCIYNTILIVTDLLSYSFHFNYVPEFAVMIKLCS
jgi:hypothetical protein